MCHPVIMRPPTFGPKYNMHMWNSTVTVDIQNYIPQRDRKYKGAREKKAFSAPTPELVKEKVVECFWSSKHSLKRLVVKQYGR